MSLYAKIKKTLTDTVDVVVDRTTLQAQKSRLRIVMRNEAKLTNDAYIELGKYLYENCRENASDSIEDICRRIDLSKERMKRAQDRYCEVLEEELVSKEITRSEVKESLHKMKEPIVSKAKDTADRVSELKDAAKEKASELKEKIPAVKVKVGHGIITDEAAEIDEVKEVSIEIAAENPTDTAADSDEAAEQVVTEPVTIANDEAAESEEDEITTDVGPEEIYSYSAPMPSNTTSNEAEPTDSAETQEFQRVMAVDIVTEEDDEEASTYVKPHTAPTASDKAKKLRNIIADNSETADPND